MIDLKGAFVMPGINDAHVHLAYAGQNKLGITVSAVPPAAVSKLGLKNGGVAVTSVRTGTPSLPW